MLYYDEALTQEYQTPEIEWAEDGSTTVCHKNIVFEEFLNTDEVASVTIGGTEIALP